MKKTVLASALAMALVSSPAFAKGNPHGSDKKEARHHDRDHDRDDHDRDRHGLDYGKKDHDREHERRVSHHSGRPPGWDKGKKTGWGDCDVPPGQAKKVGCHSHDRHVAHTRHERKPVVIARDPRSPRTTPYPRTTTTTTTTTTRTTSASKGTHPFEPVLRQKQTAGGKDTKTIRQDVR